MYRENVLVTVWAIVLLLLTPPAFAEDTMDVIYLPVGTLTLSAPRGITPRRAPVAFPHSRHFDVGCKTCHHKWDGDEPVRNCTASGCHDRIVHQKNQGSKDASKTDGMRY